MSVVAARSDKPNAVHPAGEVSRRGEEMPTANVGGVNIVYEIVGTSGPVIALMPGGRRAK